MVITISLSIFSIYFFKKEIGIFINSPNTELALLMAEKLFLKSAVSFISVSLLILVISLVIGVWFFNVISGSFLTKVKKITDQVDGIKTTDETKLLDEHLNIFIKNQHRVKELEKIESWKDSAKMLIHEIKNPLTPLKLSIESLIIEDQFTNSSLLSASNSIADIENTLKQFINMVDIEYGALEKINLFSFTSRIQQQLELEFPGIKIARYIDEETYVTTEENLLKRVIWNLVKNAYEEKPDGVSMNLSKTNTTISLEVETKDVFIDNLDLIFRQGYSSKGRNRGYGLFICQKICNYIEVKLLAQNCNNSVKFTLIFNKE